MKYRNASFLLVLCAVGCARTGDVSGTVTCNGKPVLSGTVMMSSIPGRIHYGKIQKDGTFTVTDVPAGKALAAVNSPKIVAPPGKPPSPRVTGWVRIPEKYNDLLSSELTFTVEKGENTWGIVLTGTTNEKDPQASR